MTQKTSLKANSLLWFGAAVSMAEIMTGTYIAPLGFARGIAAIILGHIIGGIFMYLAALIGAKSGMTAMETVRLSFGHKGALLFASANTIQLLGWTAVMLASGAAICGALFDYTGAYAISVVVMALLIMLCCIAGLKNVGKISAVVVSLLFLLTLILSLTVFDSNNPTVVVGKITFGAAVELSAAMPISWLPVIADYIKEAEKPQKAAAVSCLTYFAVSCWMYIIGMGAAIYAGESDIAVILLTAGLGTAALLISILSTVTTTFLDVYSAGMSAGSISCRFNNKAIMLAVCFIAALLALFAPVNNFENFLYFIGSVFVPMIAIMITDFFILKKDSSTQKVNGRNIVVWLLGFVIYRLFMQIDIPVGNTLPAMFCTILLCLVAEYIINKIKL